MQDFKRCVKLRCTRQPELTAFMSYLYDMALRSCKRMYPDVDRFVPMIKRCTPVYDEDGTACEVVSVALTEDHKEVCSFRVQQVLRETVQSLKSVSDCECKPCIR
jgi:hypothetical protein